jgi:hypothetical protein
VDFTTILFTNLEKRLQQLLEVASAHGLARTSKQNPPGTTCGPFSCSGEAWQELV